MADDTTSDGPGDRYPTSLGHVHLKVRDLDRAVEFYRELLGLDVRERLDAYAFLTFGDHHHDLALQRVGSGASGPDPGPSVGLYHAAFEVDSPEALAAVHDRVRARGIPVSPVDHGISKALYFDDPDGNGVEVYYDTRAERDRQDWQGRNEPFDPAELGESNGE